MKFISMACQLLAVAIAASAAPTDANFKAVLTDPLAWLYADSKTEAVERMDEIDVPSNGVIDINVLINGLTPDDQLTISASYSEGEWYPAMRAGPSDTIWRTTASLHKPAPAIKVSRTCCSKLSPGSITQAMPPWARLVLQSSSFFLVTSSTRPWGAK